MEKPHLHVQQKGNISPQQWQRYFLFFLYFLLYFVLTVETGMFFKKVEIDEFEKSFN